MLRLLVVLAASALSAIGAEPTFTGPVAVGELTAPPNKEASGLAVSSHDAGVLWTHDDSGGAPALYAVRARGETLGALRLQGVKNDDWEDLAAYELDGKAWLLVADTGDNEARRATVALHLVEEPALALLKPGTELEVRPARTLRVRYEDGPRDCEAVAVDRAERAVYLLTKRENIPRLYRVELEPKDPEAVAVARHVGFVSQLPELTGVQRIWKGYLGKRRNQVTAMAFAADGSGAVVLTYGNLFYFPRRPREPWAEALAREPETLPDCGLIQVEAACFSPDGRQVYVAAEGDPALLRYDRRQVGAN